MKDGNDRPVAASRRRLVTVSVVQFFASVCIMLRHYAYFLKPQFPLLASALSNVTFSDFFFCCSGFFLHYVNSNKKSVPVGTLLQKRFLRLYPLHLVTTLFYIGILVISAHSGSLGGTRSGWDCVLPTLTLTHAFGTVDRQCLNYPSWFLSALFAMYLLYPPLRLLVKKAGAGVMAALIVLIIVIYEVAYRLGGFPQWTTLTYDLGVLRGIPTFFAGIVIAEMLPAFEKRVSSFQPAYVVFGLSLAGMLAGVEPLIVQIILPVALVALLAGAEAHGAQSFLRRPNLSPVGAWSFPLYLLHAPIAAIVLNLIVVRVLHVQGPLLVVAVIAAAALAIAMAWFMHKLLDVWGPQWWQAMRPSAA
jgi:peptidoglycan/LPS O-acetylase OafA/YrhL